METILKLPFTLIDLKYQTILKHYQGFIELSPVGIRYVAEFLAEEPINMEDPDMGKEEAYNNFDIRCLKRNVLGVEKIFLSDKEYWKIAIFISGVGDDPKIYFKEEKKAEFFNKVIWEWISEKDFDYNKYKKPTKDENTNLS